MTVSLSISWFKALQCRYDLVVKPRFDLLTTATTVVACATVTLPQHLDFDIMYHALTTGLPDVFEIQSTERSSGMVMRNVSRTQVCWATIIVSELNSKSADQRC
jgi:hypothetical protein